MTETHLPVIYDAAAEARMPPHLVPLPETVAAIEPLLADPNVVEGLMAAYDENERLIRQSERARLVAALFDEADRFSRGAFADGIKHASACLLDPGFPPFKVDDGQEQGPHERSA